MFRGRDGNQLDNYDIIKCSLYANEDFDVRCDDLDYTFLIQGKNLW